jgi:hypothetical protein
MMNAGVARLHVHRLLCQHALRLCGKQVRQIAASGQDGKANACQDPAVASVHGAPHPHSLNTVSIAARDVASLVVSPA